MIRRHEWFKNRIDECLKLLSEANKLNDWVEFKNETHKLACELLYLTTEWDKYYRDINEK